MRLKCRVSDWHLSQPGFAPSYGKLVCLARPMSSDRTKQSCLWMTLSLYIYICWPALLGSDSKAPFQ